MFQNVLFYFPRIIELIAGGIRNRIAHGRQISVAVEGVLRNEYKFVVFACATTNRVKLGILHCT